MTTIVIKKSRLAALTEQLKNDMAAKGITLSNDLALKMALPVAIDEQKKIMATLRGALGTLGDVKQ